MLTSIRDKEQSEIVELPFDYRQLHDKIFNWVDQKCRVSLNLNEDESEVFRKCSHAAYYFKTEKTERQLLKDNAFIILHEKFFLTK